MTRVRLNSGASDEKGGGAFFAAPSSTPGFSSGCRLFDCVLHRGAKGYALGKIINIVGDSSTGKTLLGIEACVNYARQFPNGRIIYDETEAAFDKDYAASLGLDLSRVEFPESTFTVEDLFARVLQTLDNTPADVPVLYLVDSLDALSDAAEQARDMDEGSFGAKKAKLLSEMFRRLVKKMAGKNLTLIVISQIRDKIGVAFGEKYSRSGGHALDFYASQIIWLSHLGRIEKTVRGVKRAVGVSIRARTKKNKVNMPFREATFPIYFGFGIDDVEAGIEWLIEVKRLDGLFPSEAEAKRVAGRTQSMSSEEWQALKKRVNKQVREVWVDIEKAFIPTRSKY